MSELEQIIKSAEESIKSAMSSAALEKCRVEVLGKKGALTEVLKQVGQLSHEERKQVGQTVNEAKQHLAGLIKSRFSELERIELENKLRAEQVDITLPGIKQNQGTLHPITLVQQRIEDIFTQLGFSVEEGPEIEDDFHNFSALNIPENHPARAMQDTFYVEEGMVLRTHTSPVQIRKMKTQEPPFRMIAPGRVYRHDSDVTHTPMFNQVEGLMVDEGVSFSHLKSILTEFFQQFFGKEVPLRLRPSYFPFTEPSAEADIGCVNCGGEGCRVCSHTGWLEVAGCGLVHPNVFKSVGVDSEKYTGLAFGVGIDRLAMLYYGVDDLRLFFENDVRFLQQFQ